MVLIEKATAPTTYQDVLDTEDMVVGFNKLFGEYQKFHDSPDGTMEVKLFKKGILIKPNLDEVLRLKQQVLDQKVVLIGRDLATKGAGYAFLAMYASDYPDARALYVRDPNAAKYTNVFICNRHSNEIFRSEITRM